MGYELRVYLMCCKRNILCDFQPLRRVSPHALQPTTLTRDSPPALVLSTPSFICKFPFMKQQTESTKGLRKWQLQLHETIYESETSAGKMFDVALLACILTSIVIVMLDSVDTLHEKYGELFYILEWTFTGIFTVEYILRLICIRYPIKYVFSPLGIIDLLAIVPSYLTVIGIGSQSLLVLRALRLLRIFRIFRLVHFLSEMQFLSVAVGNSMRKISIFILFVLTSVVILGSIIYLVEGQTNGFTSIPQSIYWAIVTITTVGYGDIAPVTPLGKFIASFIMLLGYGIIAVPTGIVTTEMAIAKAAVPVLRVGEKVMTMMRGFVSIAGESCELSFIFHGIQNSESRIQNVETRNILQKSF
jgi:voltage-gated potassium channel